MDSSDRDVAVGRSGASSAAVAVDAVVAAVAMGIVSDSKRELSLSPFGCLVGHVGYKAETEELVPCRADAPVMAGVILYIVTRTWCKICRCVDAWGGSRFALRLTLSRQPLPPTLAPLALGTGHRSIRPSPFPWPYHSHRVFAQPRGRIRCETARGRPHVAASRGTIVRRDVSRETRLEKRVSRNALGQGHAGEPSSGRRRTYGANMDAYR